jgi:hypothetical protein
MVREHIIPHFGALFFFLKNLHLIGNLSSETSKMAITEQHVASPPIRHDILEVNEYLMSGLASSPIDDFFAGPVPRFTTDGLGVSGLAANLNDALERAKAAIASPQTLLAKPV